MCGGPRFIELYLPTKVWFLKEGCLFAKAGCSRSRVALIGRRGVVHLTGHDLQPVSRLSPAGSPYHHSPRLQPCCSWQGRMPHTPSHCRSPCCSHGSEWSTASDLNAVFLPKQDLRSNRHLTRELPAFMRTSHAHCRSPSIIVAFIIILWLLVATLQPWRPGQLRGVT
jgi:hypothetical protein